MPDEGFRKWLGVEYEVMEDGHAIVGLDITDDVFNLRQVVQSGVVAALIDIALATAAAGGNYDTRRRPMATLEMKVNYLAAATGDRLTAVADVMRAGAGLQRDNAFGLRQRASLGKKVRTTGS
jgi:uncharacterized protein (TIGR00369 family)